MNKKAIFSLIVYVYAYWWLIVLVVGAIFVYNVGYEYFLPEYCLSDSSENRETLSAYGFSVSDSQSSKDTICFRSRDTDLVQGMFEKMQDKRLEKELELQKLKEENRNAFLNRLLEPQYFYPILFVITIISIAFINSKRRQHY